MLFFVLLFAWSIYRAYQNNLSGTEKPMELAFLSATMRSPDLPARRPLAVGLRHQLLLLRLRDHGDAVDAERRRQHIGFNMTTALLFALTGLTAFGVVYNLVRSRATGSHAGAFREAYRPACSMLVGLLGMVLVILLGNFQMIFVEFPTRRSTASPDYLQFWDMNGAADPTTGGGRYAIVSNWEYWWWFRRARALNDRNLDGSHDGSDRRVPRLQLPAGGQSSARAGAAVRGAGARAGAEYLLLTRRKPNRYEIVFYSVCFGGLIFLNTWDGPIYLIVLVAAEALRRLMRGRLRSQDWRELALARRDAAGAGAAVLSAVCRGVPLAGGGHLAQSAHTRRCSGSIFLMFGPLLLLIAPFLAVEVWRAGARMNWQLGIQIGLFVLAVLVVAMLLLAALGCGYSRCAGCGLNFVNTNGGWGAVDPGAACQAHDLHC